jgi:hypothetical protein
MYVSTVKPAQLPKPGAHMESFLVKYDPASRLKCTTTLIIDDIQYSRKSCHDEYEFRTVSFTISGCTLHFINRNYNTYNSNFPNTTNRLLYYPSLRAIYHTEPAGSCDQPRPFPGSFLNKREEPGNEVD